MDVARPILQEAIRERRAIATDEEWLGAWVVLVALSEQEAWAKEMAESEFANDAKVQRGSIAALAQAEVRMPEWFCALAARHSDTISPGNWADMRNIPPIRPNPAHVPPHINALWHLVHTQAAFVREPFPVTEFETIWQATGEPLGIQTLVPLRPWQSNDPGWIDFLVRVGQSRNVSISKAPLGNLPGYLSDLYNEDPSRTGLLALLKLVVWCGEPTRVNPAYLQPDRFEDEHVRQDAYLVRFAQGDVNPNDVEAECASLAQASAGDWWPVSFVLPAVEKLQLETAIVEPALLGMVRHMPPEGWDLARSAIERMRILLGSRPTGLDDAATWNRLHLPHPRPERQRASKPAPAPIPIRSMKSIRLQKIRSFDTLEIAVAPPLADQGQWIVLLGENGVGKTTILRGIALALYGRDALPKNAFDTALRRFGIENDEESFVEVQFTDGKTARADIKHGVPREDIDCATTPPLMAVFGYGCRRGSALGGARRRSEVDPGHDVDTLFDEGAEVIDAETWLLMRERQAMKAKDPNGPAGRIFRTVKDALKQVLHVDEIRSDETQILVDIPERGTVPLRAMSDGYLTAMGWVVDLIARWVSRPEQKDLIEEGFTQTMTGLVLIDEIDLHLHPEWQMRVIDDVRRVFPQMSFVVTTHNPATVVGARPEEIWILRNDNGETLASQRSEDPKLMTGSEIYTSYFDVPNMNPTFAEDMQRYGFLSGMANRTDEEEAEVYGLLQKLRDQGADPGWEPVARESSNHHAQQ